MFWASENSVGPVTFYLNWPCWLVESLVLSLPLHYTVWDLNEQFSVEPQISDMKYKTA